jgi:chemotaxis protein histidine kinase CheA
MESAENQAQPKVDTATESISQPLSKTETIALLNDSIDRLEETIKKISEDSAKIPSSDSINSLLAKAQELEKSVTAKSNLRKSKAETPSQLTTPKATPKVSKPKVSTPAKASTKTRIKASTTQAVKTSIPKASQKKNLGFIVIGVTAIASLIVTVFWLWKPQAIANLFPKTEPAPTEVAIKFVPAQESLAEKSPEKSPTNSLVDAPEPSAQIDPQKLPDFAPEMEPLAESAEGGADTTDTTETLVTVIPPELTSPGKPKNLKMITIKPELNFTPEQNLIAALTTKLRELTQDYPSEFIQDIQVNLPDNSLIVRVTDSWYELEESRQNSLGNEILGRSRTFSFDKLELQDKMGTLIARNPIIGGNIIMIQNKKQQQSEKLTEKLTEPLSENLVPIQN